MTYEADRWRDRSIIAQCALKAAVDLLEYQPVDPELTSPFIDRVKLYQKELFDATMELVGPDVQTTTSKGSSGQSSPRPAGQKPYANTKVPFGKFKGMTIGEIDNAVGDDGKTGHSWLEWLAANTDNEFMKKAVTGFLEAS